MPLTQKQIEEINRPQIDRIIRAVLPHRINAEAVLRVASGDWAASHPVDRAILRELDKMGEKKS